MNTLFRAIAVISITFLASNIHAFNNPQFYRANYAFFETRLEKPWLTSLDAGVGYGKTSSARDDHSSEVSILNIYGLQDFQHLGECVPNQDIESAATQTLTLASRLPDRENFGKVAFCGDFSLVEADLWFTQNFSGGFFFQAAIPVRNIKVTNNGCVDMSPQDDIYPNANTPIWQALLNQMAPILKEYNISLADVDKTGAGDLVLSLGWTQNCHEISDLDFVDTTLSFGVLAPTSKKQDYNLAFDLPLGYNGHIGMPFEAGVAAGAYDWFTLGGYLNAVCFFHTTDTIPLKTHSEQEGIIKLARGEVKIDRGTLWQAAGYAKADHVVRGLSLFAGYSFVKQNPTSLTPTCDNSECFDPCIINSDVALQGWRMHTLNFMVDYDFTKEDSFLGPRFGVFYNMQVGGQRIYKTNMAGGTLGLDLAWRF